MPDLFFPDTSNAQANIDFAALRAFTPANASQVCWGTNPTINQTPGRIPAVRAENFIVNLWYLGLVWNQDITAQVNTFTGLIPSLLPNEGIFIDWEFSLGGTPTGAQRDQAANELAAFYNRPRVLIGTYGGPSDLESSPPPSWVIVADYGPPDGKEPSIKHDVWQYTNGEIPSPPYMPINYPGIGFCDSNLFHGTVEQLATLVLPASKPKEDPVGSSSKFFRTTTATPVLPLGSIIAVQVNASGDLYVKNAGPTDPLTGPDSKEKNQHIGGGYVQGTLDMEANAAGTGVEGVVQMVTGELMQYINIPGTLNSDGSVVVGLENMD